MHLNAHFLSPLPAALVLLTAGCSSPQPTPIVTPVPSTGSVAIADASSGEHLRTTIDDLSLVIDTSLDNVANLHTIGFKRRAVTLESDHDGSFIESVASGARTNGVSVVFDQGTIDSTGRSLDLAIEGRGLLVRRAADGSETYSRNGRLAVSADGRLVAADGVPIWPDIAVPDDALELSIDPDGRVGALCASSPETPLVLGQLLLARFVDPSGLVAVSDTAFCASAKSGDPVHTTPGTVGCGKLLQGSVECSNVESDDEMATIEQATSARSSILVRLVDAGVPNAQPSH